MFGLRFHWKLKFVIIPDEHEENRNIPAGIIRKWLIIL